MAHHNYVKNKRQSSIQSSIESIISKLSLLIHHSFTAPLSFIIIMCCIFFAPPVRLNFIVGSSFSFFSIKSCLIPLSGAFGGIAGSGLLSLVRLLFSLSSPGITITPLSVLALYVPGFFGSLYWATSSALVRIGIPAACMLLFCSHSIGSSAWAYSLFWLIPIILYFVPRKPLFLESLGSTFTAHAVGSVIWLYTVGMTPALWLGLIPVVCLERLLCATGMTAAYFAATKTEIAIRSALHTCFSNYTTLFSTLFLPSK